MAGIVDLGQQHESSEERQKKIVDVLVEAFSELMAADPDAFRKQVPEDGRRPVRLLSWERVHVLRGHGG